MKKKLRKKSKKRTRMVFKELSQRDESWMLWYSNHVWDNMKYFGDNLVLHTIAELLEKFRQRKNNENK